MGIVGRESRVEDRSVFVFQEAQNIIRRPMPRGASLQVLKWPKFRGQYVLFSRCHRMQQVWGKRKSRLLTRSTVVGAWPVLGTFSARRYAPTACVTHVPKPDYVLGRAPGFVSPPPRTCPDPLPRLLGRLLQRRSTPRSTMSMSAVSLAVPRRSLPHSHDDTLVVP